MLIKGCCLLEHSGDNCKENPAFKEKVIVCIVCMWSPFPQTVSISPISKCPRHQHPCVQCKMVAVRERGLKEHALKEGQLTVWTVSQQQICLYFGQMNAQSPKTSSSRNTAALSFSQKGFETPALENITFPIVSPVKHRYILSEQKGKRKKGEFFLSQPTDLFPCLY